MRAHQERHNLGLYILLGTAFLVFLGLLLGVFQGVGAWSHSTIGVKLDAFFLAFTVSVGGIAVYAIFTGQTLVRDIEGRKRLDEEKVAVEAALNESNRLYESLLQNVPAVTWVLDASGKVTYVSPNILELYGYHPEELMGDDDLAWADLVHPDDRERALEAFESLFSGGPFDLEYRVKHKSGHWIWIHDKGTIVHETGGVLYAYGVSTDITVHKEADQAVAAAKDDLEKRVDDRTGELLRANEILQAEVDSRRKAETNLTVSDQRYRALVETSPDGIMLMKLDTEITMVNRRAVEMLGYDRTEELVGRKALGLLSTEDRKRMRRLLDGVAGLKHPQKFEMDLHRKDGTTVPVEVNFAALRDRSQEPYRIIAIGRDISHNKAAQEALEKAKSELEETVRRLRETADEVNLTTELSDRLHACSTAEEAYSVISHYVQKLFPGTSGALAVISPSKNILEAVALWGDGEIGDLLYPPENCWALRRGKENIVGRPSRDLPCTHFAGSAAGYMCFPMLAQGEALGTLLITVPAELAADDGGEEWLAAKRPLAESVAEHIALSLANLRLREKLRFQSIRDSLTGLLNRRFLEEALEKEVRRAARGGQKVSVIMLDLDHFKDFNDTFGHAAGDMLLAAFGTFLRSHVREEDVACRYGGEEFAMILPEVGMESAVTRAKQICAGTKEIELSHEGHPLGTITISAGVAVFPDNAPNGPATLNAADTALYRAKAQGRDCVVRSTARPEDHHDWEPEGISA